MREILMTESEVATFLGVSFNSVRRWRCADIGLPYRRYARNHIRYAKRDVIAFKKLREREPWNALKPLKNPGAE